ncbi:unnamed protein product [Cylindrotheca closterium]|uniref:Ubiquitin-like protein ATG12 n=1 Tax=Cylindrotheca closterium TaxID=2856 RepID=A0AAD2G7Z3_9STRA|nr:unnamed protein product [Cylindrotheca closterium]
MSSSKPTSDAKDAESAAAEITSVSGSSDSKAPQGTPSASTPLSAAAAAAAAPSDANQPKVEVTVPSPSPSPSRKVKVHFVPVGSAPILKKTKFQISADQRFAAVHTFLRKLLKMNHTGSTTTNYGNSSAAVPPPLFLYLTSAFCPSLEEIVGELDECFSKRGELVVHYSLQEAWG